MIVHAPEIRTKDGTLRLCARIEYEKPAPGMSPELWFDMPASQERYLSPRMDGFAANLLLVAMRRGEPLTLRGTISEELAHGMNEYQKAATAVEPREARRIEVRADGYENAKGPIPNGVGLPTGVGVPTAVGMPFSGGVDSFYTLWLHTPPRELSPAFQVTHGIFIQGEDIAYAEIPTIRTCLEAYGEIFAAMGMELMTVRTNVRDLYPDADWGWMSFPHLLGVGLLFGKLFRRFFTSMGGTYSDWLNNSYPLLDHFFSTETMDMVNVGAGVKRIDKLATLAQWEPARKSLRVCYTKPDGLNNCCRCPKCLHAMAILDTLGELQNFPTFPKGYTRAQLRGARFAPDLCAWVNDTRKRAVQAGRRDIAMDLSWVIGVSVVTWSAKRGRKEISKRIKKH